jgi:hypothetical protein
MVNVRRRTMDARKGYGGELDGELENSDFREEKSDEEAEAEGGMRMTEPGLNGVERMEEWIAEANDVEGHTPLADGSRRHVDEDAGFEGDLAPEGWTGKDLDRRRRAAKSRETDHHPPAEFYGERETS